MTFAYSQIELYVDSEDKVLTLIIEHPDFFYTVLNDINDQIEGGTGFSVISCNAKLISFAKQATMITEFVPFEMMILMYRGPKLVGTGEVTKRFPWRKFPVDVGVTEI